jgi:hypothetical protein
VLEPDETEGEGSESGGGVSEGDDDGGGDGGSGDEEGDDTDSESETSDGSDYSPDDANPPGSPAQTALRLVGFLVLVFLVLALGYRLG